MNGPNLPPVAASNVVIRASPSPYMTILLAYHILGQEMSCMVGSCVLESVCVCVGKELVNIVVQAKSQRESHTP